MPPRLPPAGPPGGGLPPSTPPPPSEPPPNPNIPIIKTREPAPSFSGTVRIATFADLVIATGEKEKKDHGPLVDMAKVEAAVKRIRGVNSYSVDAAHREITVGFAGPVSDVKNIKIAIDGQALANEVISPARVVIRPIGKIERPEAAATALKGTGGVVAVEAEYNDLVAYAQWHSDKE
jgi:copper chaperone CopZ